MAGFLLARWRFSLAALTTRVRPAYNLPVAKDDQADDEQPDNSTVGDGNYVVRSGDCLSKIAGAFGFDWQTLWDLPENLELKQKRKDPNVLFPGDQLYVPNLRVKHHDAETDKLHRFQRKGTPARLRLRFLEDGDARQYESYVLNIDGDLRNGTLDKDGKLNEWIPPTADSVEITIGDDDPMTLKLGTVDPIAKISGVQGRLSNLGFDPGPIDNKIGPKTRHAIRRFQNKFDLDVTGQPDQTTRDKLVETHGC